MPSTGTPRGTRDGQITGASVLGPGGQSLRFYTREDSDVATRRVFDVGRPATATPPPVGSARGRQAAVAVVLALLLLAALAGALSQTASGSGSLRSGATSTALTVAVTLGGLGVVVLAAFVFYLAIMRRRSSFAAESFVRRPWWYSLAVALAIALVVGLVLLLHRRHDLQGLPLKAAAPRAAKAVHASRVHFVPADSLTTVAIVVAVVVLLVAAGWWKARRMGLTHRLGDLVFNRSADTASPPPAPSLAASIRAVRVADPEEETDPRRAVVACYLAMTRAAGDAGAERAPSETPSEYLQRLLAALGASHAAARRLTALFEAARYSTATMDESIRADAIAALRAVQVELRRSPGPPAHPEPAIAGRRPARLNTLGQP